VGRHLAPHQGHGFRHRTVRVDIDGLDPTAAHHHLPAWCGAAGWQQGLGGICHTTADKYDVSHGAELILEELFIRAHHLPSGAVA
jgi:hypothetical protein